VAVNRNGDRLFNDDGDLLDNRDLKGVVLLYRDGIGLVDVNSVRLGDLDLNGNLVGLLDNVGLGHVNNVGFGHANNMGHRVRFLHFNSVGNWYFLGHWDLLVNGVVLVHDIGYLHWLWYGHTLVYRIGLMYRYNVWLRDIMGDRVRLMHRLHNNIDLGSVVTMTTSIPSIKTSKSTSVASTKITSISTEITSSMTSISTEITSSISTEITSTITSMATSKGQTGKAGSDHSNESTHYFITSEK